MGRSLGKKLSDWWLGGLAGPPSAPDPWETGWRTALRSACEVLVDTQEGIEAIDLRGDRWVRAKPGRLLRLNDLSREVAGIYGVTTDVRYVDDAPVVHVTRLS